MVADGDLPYFRGYSRQRGRGYGALAQTIERTAVFLDNMLYQQLRELVLT